MLLQLFYTEVFQSPYFLLFIYISTNKDALALEIH